MCDKLLYGSKWKNERETIQLWFETNSINKLYLKEE